MPFYLLLGMQAAGMIFDFFGTRNQDNLMDLGMKVKQAGIEANLAQTQLETQEQSLQAMKQLRQTMGSQIASNAARGTMSGAGSALSLLTESQGNFNADERIRKLNLLGKTNQLHADSAMSRLQYSSDSSKLWQGFASRTINRFPSTVAGWEQGIKDFKQGFGLTSIVGG